MPAFGTAPTVWTMGWWKTPLKDISLQAHSDSGDNEWGKLKWKESNTDDEDAAYVRVDLLDDAGATLQGNLAGTKFGEWKEIDISDYSNANTVDIYVVFKLYAKTKQPAVSDLCIEPKNAD